jgi:hypothetical protein
MSSQMASVLGCLVARDLNASPNDFLEDEEEEEEEGTVGM